MIVFYVVECDLSILKGKEVDHTIRRVWVDILII